jgi:hypothetical protein
MERVRQNCTSAVVTCPPVTVAFASEESAVAVDPSLPSVVRTAETVNAAAGTTGHA